MYVFVYDSFGWELHDFLNDSFGWELHVFLYVDGNRRWVYYVSDQQQLLNQSLHKILFCKLVYQTQATIAEFIFFIITVNFVKYVNSN